MPLDFFPPEQESTIRVIAGQRSYRLVTPERVMVVNDKTFAADEDNRFSPLARLQIIGPDHTTLNAQSGGLSPDCGPYWVNDVVNRFAVGIASVRTQQSAILPAFTEFQIRQSVGGVPTVRITLSLGAAKALRSEDVRGLLVQDSGLMSNELEIWGRIPSAAANPAQTNAVPFFVTFWILVEAWPATPNDGILGKFVTQIP